MTITNFFFRVINKISVISFRRYAFRRCASCGKNVAASWNWSLVHPECISIGDNFSASTNLRLQAWPEYMGESTAYLRADERKPELVIGGNVTMVSNCQVSCANRVEIGDGCLFGDNVFVTDNFHGGTSDSSELGIPPGERKLTSKGPVKIGKNCWLGRNVCVMSGVTIGDGCTIGANAVVTHDIPAYSVAVGVPAKVIKKLR